MKPIETDYHGVRFRSRLEARWAVFFDAMSIEWRYEDEGYELPSGRYLPDFLLPACGTWIEVRGDVGRVDLDELAIKARELPTKPIMEPGPRQKIERGPQLMLLGPIPADQLNQGDYGWLAFAPWFDGWCRYGFGTWHKNTRPWAHSALPGLESPLIPTVEEFEWSDAMDAYAKARAERFWR